MGNEQLTELHSILQGQRDVLTEMVAAAEQQQQALLNRDRDAIATTTEAQDELFATLQSLEFDRMQLQQQLGVDPGAQNPGLAFEQMLRTLPAQTKQAITDVRDEARALLLKLSALNSANQELLAQEVVMFDLYMSVLHPDMSAEVYSEPGQARPSTGSAAVAFDTRA